MGEGCEGDGEAGGKILGETGGEIVGNFRKFSEMLVIEGEGYEPIQEVPNATVLVRG